MINYTYQLIAPRVITVKYSNIDIGADRVIVRPEYMSICHADQRYYTGSRDAAVMRKKLPMALIHECAGRVVYDPTANFKIGEKVIMIPNVLGTPVEGVYENYLGDGGFLSSGRDGFMREFVALSPNRIVSCEGVPQKLAAFAEFVSVAFHAADRFQRAAQTNIGSIGIWGDGGLGYLVAMTLRHLLPKAKIAVIGMDPMKLALFTFADETHLSTELPKDFHIDHAFECAGGDGCYFAGKQIIDVINPQGTYMLMGVSEKEVPLNTRMVLERGLTLVGCSRSGRADFEKVAEFMRDKTTQQRLERIVSEVIEINCVDDIHTAFDHDIANPFKTVLKWNI